MFMSDTPRSGWMVARAFVPQFTAANHLTAFASQTNRLLATWVDRIRKRRELARLDDRMLSDIGVTRLAADREVNKNFWQG